MKEKQLLVAGTHTICGRVCDERKVMRSKACRLSCATLENWLDVRAWMAYVRQITFQKYNKFRAKRARDGCHCSRRVARKLIPFSSFQSTCPSSFCAQLNIWLVPVPVPVPSHCRHWLAFKKSFWRSWTTAHGGSLMNCMPHRCKRSYFHFPLLRVIEWCVSDFMYNSYELYVHPSASRLVMWWCV